VLFILEGKSTLLDPTLAILEQQGRPKVFELLSELIMLEAYYV
jgi:hypothetical protein